MTFVSRDNRLSVMSLILSLLGALVVFHKGKEIRCTKGVKGEGIANNAGCNPG